MNRATGWMGVALACLLGCDGAAKDKVAAGPMVAASANAVGQEYVGFDRNDYPGDERLAQLRKTFAFVGFWLTPPPTEKVNGWKGKRGAVRDAGFGFMLLADGRLDADIKRANVRAAMLGKNDAAIAVAAAKSEGFPVGATIYLDQEEGGRLLPEQAEYFFGWTEAVAASGYKAGAYLSGQKDADGKGPDGRTIYITTAADVREHIAKEKRHAVALWVYDDTCPPAPGCVVRAPKLAASGTDGAMVWQYAQSPRRPEVTRSCAQTYAADGQCYAGVSKDLVLDLDVAASADPSAGR